MAKKKEANAVEKPTHKRSSPLMLIAGGLLGVIVLAVGGLFAYVALLPDDMPKPFYLSLEPPPAHAAGGEAGAEPTPAETSAPEAASSAVEPAAPPALPLPGEGLMFDTGTKIVNLTDPGGRRYLKVSIVLEFAPHSAEFYTAQGEERVLLVDQFTEELTSRRPLLDDLLITILTSKSFEQVYSVAGKEALRQEIVASVNEFLPSEILMYVYFTEFVVQ